MGRAGADGNPEWLLLALAAPRRFGSAGDGYAQVVALQGSISNLQTLQHGMQLQDIGTRVHSSGICRARRYWERLIAIFAWLGRCRMAAVARGVELRWFRRRLQLLGHDMERSTHGRNARPRGLNA